MTFPSEQQRLAIEADLGPVLVVAGPGAGKTSCLVARIQHLIERRGLAADRLCAITFTNKAAGEIAHRLRQALGPEAEDITGGTIHSLCLGMLRSHGGEIGLQAGFGVADEDYQHTVLAQLRVPRKYRGMLLNRFGRHRLQGYELTPDDQKLLGQYQEKLHAANMVDFDELVVLAAALLDSRPDIATQVAARWDYVLVDECQDLNVRQYRVICHLVAGHHNLFAVGDDEQSIFSWASADPQVLMELANDFAITRPIVLDVNCRCSSRIFAAARRLIEKNPPLFTKELRAGRESPYEVEARIFGDEQEEGEWIVRALKEDQATSGLSWGEYGILYRKHDSGMHLEGRLLAAGIPCRLSRGRSISDDRIIGQVLASLRVMLAPSDEVAIEALADRVLPSMLMDQVRNHFAHQGIIAGLKVFARERKGEPDARKAWRFIFALENLRALERSAYSLEGLVRAVLEHGVGPYRNPLESEELVTDPARYPGASDLAACLAEVRKRGGRIWISPLGGVEYPLRGMLVKAGFSLTTVGDGGGREDDDLVLDPRATPGFPLLLFKALQLEESQGWEDSHQNFVAFDLETTDKDVNGCEAVEIGAVRVRDGQIVDTFRSLIKCTRRISPRATEVHGFRDADLVDAPPFAQVWEQFCEFVGRDFLLAHNGIGFDVPVLRRLAGGLPGIDQMVFYDSLPLARAISSQSARLGDLAIRYGIDIGRAHHALDDAIALARVYGCLNRERIGRARKAALTNLLDDLGLALVLDPPAGSPEVNKLRDLTRVYTLGRFGESLDAYTRERRPEHPTRDEVIEQLGGQRLMDRLRAARSPEEKYPVAVARLNALVSAIEATDIVEATRTLLDRVALSRSDGEEADRDRVNLLTLHATKGLEFSRVFVVGVEDNEMPGSQALAHHRLGEIEEARRLLYVGMTRAKDRLVLTRTFSRRGEPTGDATFLEEIGVASPAIRS